MRVFATRDARLVLVAAAIAGMLPAAARAVSPKYWIHDSAEELFKGEPAGVSVLADGSLRLAPSIDKISDIDEPYVWDTACDPKSGAIYLGTGDEGRVWRVTGGKAVLYFQCAGLETFSVAVDGKGRVFAGSAPEGLIYRIDGEGKGIVLYDAQESYPWDLEIGTDGKLYAAMGSPGAVYRIDPESGKAEKIFETDDNHVVCLAFDADGSVVLGTEGRGLVARIAKDGTSRVLYDCPQGEVSAVLAGKSGDVWAAAAVPSDVRETTTTEPQSNPDGTGLRIPFEITATTSDEAVLYRVDASGNARRAWESGQGAIYDLAWADDGRVLAVTGEKAGVHAIDDEGEATLVFKADEEQVVAISRAPNGDLIYATANPSRVYRAEKGLGQKGTFVSEVLDARWTATWGRIEWDGAEYGGSVRLDVRAGNTDKPDRTWTDWQGNIQRSGDLSFLQKARFLQWRATLSGDGGASPVVRRVRVSSLENNLPPHIAKVQIVPSGNRFFEDVPELRPRTLHQQIPGGARVQYSYEGDADEEFPPEMRAPWTQGMRQVQWEAGDPNEDYLVFDLEYRHEDESRWKMFAEEIEGKNFSFDSKGVPDGSYAIRVTASDRRFNPGNERTDSRESEMFLVDNTPPTFHDVSMRREQGKLAVKGKLRDELSDVVRIEWSLDGGDWKDTPSSDGIFDSREEAFSVSIEAASGEEHSVVLRGVDLPGNLGTSRFLERR